jgi:PHD/YefM family antitoxin component YafN of YafNO toxin-antitoxin module
MTAAKFDPHQTAAVPAHRVQRAWGEVSDQALRDPVVITAKGRPRHVLMAYDEYLRLKARDRRAWRIEDLPEDLATMLEAGLDELRNAVPEDGDNIIG